MAPPPPYVATPSSFGQADSFSTVPHFHPGTNGDRFGFQESTPLVPPGTEPDLQAINNLFVTARREKERQLAASQAAHPNAGGSLADLMHQVPYFSLGSQSFSHPPSHSYSCVNQNIDPSLCGPAISRNNRNRSNGQGKRDDEGYSSDGSTSGHSGTSDEEHESRGQHAPRGQIYFTCCDHSLTLIYRLCHRSAEHSENQARVTSGG